MTTIADLLRMEPVAVLRGIAIDRHVSSFLQRFAPYMGEFVASMPEDEPPLDRIGVSILLEAEDEGSTHSLGRIEFEGAVMALFRHDPDGDSKWTWKLTDKGVADRLCDAVRLLMDERDMIQADPGEDAGALVDFGPNAVRDEAAASLRFQKVERIMSATHGDKVVGLLMGNEDGTAFVWHRGDEEDDSAYSPAMDIESACSKFLDGVHEGLLARSVERHPYIVHMGDGKSLGFMQKNCSLFTDVVETSRAEIETVATGDDALPEFLAMLRRSLDAAVLSRTRVEEPVAARGP